MLTDYALALADLGFKVIKLQKWEPVGALCTLEAIKAADKRTKVPVEPAYQLRPGATEEEIQGWNGAHNYGIHAQGRMVLVDGDTEESVKWIEENLPPTPMRFKTRQGKHFWYRSDEINAGSQCRDEGRGIKVDVIVNGFGVGPGSMRIGDDGTPWAAYQLDDGARLELGPDELPELRREDVERLERLGGDRLGRECFFELEMDSTGIKRAHAKTLRTQHDWCFPTPAGEGNQGAMDVLWFAIKCDELPREAVEHRLERWNDLRESIGAERHKETAAKVRHFWEHKWADFVNGEHYGAFKGEREKKEGLSKLEQEIREALKDEEPAEPVVEEDSLDYPEICKTIPGDLQLFVDYFMSNAVSPHLDIAIFSALSLGSVVASRRYRTATKSRALYSSLYQVVVAGTGVGKEFAQGLIPDVLEAAGCEYLEGGGGFSSVGALISELKESPNHWAVMDEFGDILKAKKDKRNSNATAVWAALKSIYSKNGKKWQPPAYSREGKAGMGLDRREPVRNPGITIFGSTTQRQLMRSLTSEELEDGLLNRFLFCVNESEREETPIPEGDELGADESFEQLAEVPGGLVRWVETAAGLETQHIKTLREFENLTIEQIDEVRKNRWRKKPVDQIVVRFTPEARKWFNDSEKLDGNNPMFARVSENSIRIMVILAVSVDPEIPVITKDMAEWATAFVKYSAQRFNRLFVENLTESKYQEMFNFVRDKVKSSRGKGIPASKLNELLTRLTMKERSEVVRDLVTQGVVLFGRPAGAHKKIKRFYHSSFIDSSKFETEAL